MANITAIKMLIEHDGCSIQIVSGEGEGQGHAYYTKSRTKIGIDRILTRERCGGDRWAFAVITLGGGHQFRYALGELEQIA